jgi:hypothetical protein
MNWKTILVSQAVLVAFSACYITSTSAADEKSTRIYPVPGREGGVSSKSDTNASHNRYSGRDPLENPNGHPRRRDSNAVGREPSQKLYPPDKPQVEAISVCMTKPHLCKKE